MKVYLTFFLVIIHLITLQAQTPSRISYQAIVRNSNNQLVSNQVVGVRISILKGSANGVVSYSEEHKPLSNENGLITLQIGGGTLVSGNFLAIDWSNDVYFIKTDLDPAGNANYTISSVSQLLTVPYAFHAKTAEALVNPIVETDPFFLESTAGKIKAADTIRWNNKSTFSGDYNDLTNKPDLSLYLVEESDDDVLNEIQSLRVSLIGDTLSLSKSNYVIIPGISAGNYNNVDWTPGEEWLDQLEGEYYKTVQIGTQIWMAENLRSEKYNDGTYIGNLIDNTGWMNSMTGAFSWYNNNSNNESMYGMLYNWYAVATNKLCMTGWHIPTEAEWQILIDHLGGSGIAGGKLKETGIVNWQNQNFGASNQSGFTALPGGYRTETGLFLGLNQMGSWWSSTEYTLDASRALGVEMSGGNTAAAKINISKKSGFSVRCVKD